MRWVLIALGILAGAFFFAPREEVRPDLVSRVYVPISPDTDLNRWLAEAEAAVPGIKPGAEKRIIWAGEPGEMTPLSVVYLHGFSAASEEMRPLPDKVAEALGANLYFARLTGHARDGEALAAARAGNWLHDTYEAMDIGRRIGERVLIIGCSTGATLAAMAASDPDLQAELAGVALISPNFGALAAGSQLLTLPFARLWVPVIAGSERSWEPINAGQAEWWQHRYPMTAVIPVAALSKAAFELDHGATEAPALFVFAETDQVVDPAKTRSVAAAWGGPSEVAVIVPEGQVDPSHHVLAGDILSPDLTQPVTERIVSWAKGL